LAPALCGGSSAFAKPSFSAGLVDAMEQSNYELEECMPSCMYHAVEADMMLQSLLLQFGPLVNPSESILSAMREDELPELQPPTLTSKLQGSVWEFALAEANEAAAMRLDACSAVAAAPLSGGLHALAMENLPSRESHPQLGAVCQTPRKVPIPQHLEQALPPSEGFGRRPRIDGSFLVDHNGIPPPPGLLAAPHEAKPHRESADALATEPSSAKDMPLKIPIPRSTDVGFRQCQQQHFFSPSSSDCSTPMLSAASQARTAGGTRRCRWHKSAETVGVISEDGHVFTKTAGPRRSRISDHGAKVDLASICMVFDESLRIGGLHRYTYQIIDGKMGLPDGAGFVFERKVRRNNIQRMRSVFLNQRGRICLRNNGHVTKLQAQLPPLTVGVCLSIVVDLDNLIAHFHISEPGQCMRVGGCETRQPLRRWTWRWLTSQRFLLRSCHRRYHHRFAVSRPSRRAQTEDMLTLFVRRRAPAKRAFN